MSVKSFGWRVPASAAAASYQVYSRVPDMTWEALPYRSPCGRGRDGVRFGGRHDGVLHAEGLEEPVLEQRRHTTVQLLDDQPSGISIMLLLVVAGHRAPNIIAGRTRWDRAGPVGVLPGRVVVHGRERSRGVGGATQPAAHLQQLGEHDLVAVGNVGHVLRRRIGELPLPPRPAAGSRLTSSSWSSKRSGSRVSASGRSSVPSSVVQ